MQNRWDGIEEFVAVTERGSFSAAAQQLGVSKAHVSQQVNRLEDRLGTRLLHRTTRKVALTETGKMYVEQCRSIIEELNSVELSISGIQKSISGRLRISTPHLIGEEFLIPALTAFQQQHQALDIDIDLSSRRVNLIEDRYDIAIQLGKRDDVNVINRFLATSRFHVVASPQYIERFGEPDSPEALSEHQCLLFSSEGRSKPWKFASAKGTIEVPVKSKWRSNSGHILRSACKQGFGLAYLPDYYLQEDIINGSLVCVMQNTQSIDRRLVAIYQHRSHLSNKIRVFVEYLSDFFSTQQDRFSISSR